MTPVHPQRTARRRLRPPARRLAVAFALVTVALLTSSGLAQHGRVWLDASGDGEATSLATTLAVTALRVDASDVDAWARIGVRLAGPREHDAARPRAGSHALLGAGIAARRTTTFGQLGNVTLEGGGSLARSPTSEAAAVTRAWLGVRGTVATVALNLALEAGNAAPRVVDPVRPAPPDAAGQAGLRALDDQRARAAAPSGAWDVGGRLGVVYRLDRATTLSADGSLRSLAGAPAYGVGLDLRALGVADDVDAWLGVRLDRLALTTSGAVGLGWYHVPRRGPTSWLRGWLGAGPAGVRPGVDASWTTRVVPGELSLTGAWRPWLSVHAWESAIEYRHAVASGGLRYRLALEGDASAGVRWSASVRWDRPW